MKYDKNNENISYYKEDFDYESKYNSYYENIDLDVNQVDKVKSSGDKFFNNVAIVFETFMGVANWIMNNAYLIAVIIVFVLFIIKLRN